MGKDYSLAIIIVNCDDNLWTDQNLQSDPDLPSGWRTITDSTGTYYWHLSSGATQWEHPRTTANGPKTPTANGPKKLQEEETQSPSEKPEEDFQRSSWHEEYLTQNHPDSKVFSVRALGWMQVLEEDLGPGRSSLAVSQVIQQLSHCQDRTKTQTRSSGSPGQNRTRSRPQDQEQDQAQPLEACGEGREMKLVLKKDSLILLDPLDHTPLHCQPINNIRVWGVGCNNGRDRDFAFVAGDKHSCVLKCHVFRCDVPAKTIATALHQLCSKMMSETRPTRSLTMESISPEDFPRQVECVEAVQQQVQKFRVRYMGNIPVSRAMGMEVLNRAIESLMNSSDPDDWEPSVLHVSHSALCLWRGEEGSEPLWELPVQALTFLGVGQDSHTFAVIADRGTQRFSCHVFYCNPHAGEISEAVQAACMAQYQRCLVAQTPRLGPKVKRAASVDATATSLHRFHGNGSSSALSSSASNISGAGVSISVSSVRRVMAFFETLRNKQTATF